MTEQTKEQLAKEYPHIDFKRLGIAVGVCLIVLTIAAIVL